MTKSGWVQTGSIHKGGIRMLRKWIIGLFICIGVLSGSFLGWATVYVDTFQLIHPGQNPYFYIYSSGQKDVSVGIYRLNKDAGPIPSYRVGDPHYPLAEQTVARFSVPIRTRWERIDLPHSLFQDIGRYLVAVQEEDQWSHMVVEKTGLAGVALVHDDGVWVRLWDILTGQFVESAQVFTDSDFYTHIGTLSSQGSARFPLNDVKDGSLQITSSRGNAYIYLDPSTDFEQRKLLLVTDRPMYRPGDPVQIRGYLFETGSGSFVTDGSIDLTILDPRGRETQAESISLDAYGGFSYERATFSEDIRGHYRILIQYEDQTFTRYFHLSDYQKPPFTLEISEIQSLYGIGEAPSFTIKGRYYYGQHVDQGIVSYKLYALSPEWDPRDEWLIMSQSHVLSAPQLSLPLHIPTEDHGKYRLEVTLVDSSGRDVMEARYFEYIPLDVKIHVSTPITWLTPGDLWPVHVSIHPLVDQAPMARIMMMQLLVDGHLVEEKSFQTDSSGNHRLLIPASDPGRYQIRVFDPQNPDYIQTIRAFCYSPTHPYRTTMDIDFLLDAPIYQPGDLARVKILSKYSDLHALLIINAGTQIWSRSVFLEKGESAWILEIPSNIKANRIEVRCIAFHSGIRVDKTFSIPIHPMESEIELVITTPESSSPGATIPILIETRDHRDQTIPAVVTLNLIDQALLDLYGMDDWETLLDGLDELPHRYWIGFFNEYLYPFLQVGSLMNDSLYDAPETLAQTKAALDGVSIQTRSEFSDTAFWKDALWVEGQLLAEIPLPQDLTTWRVRALAIGADGFRGYGHSQFYTTLPVTVQPVFPKFMISGDRIQIGWNVGNYTGEDQIFDFIMEFEGQTVRANLPVSNGQTRMVWWMIEVPGFDQIQNTSFFARAQSGDWGDAMIHTVPIHPRSFSTRSGSSGVLGKEPVQIDLAIEAPTRLTLTLSSGLESELLSALEYLIQYPYGCVEQVVSSFLPTIAALSLVKDSALPLARMIQDRIPQITENGLARLYGYQKHTGDWGWWRDDKPDLFMTAYVLYALYHLAQAEYPINEDVVAKGLNALDEMIVSASTSAPHYGFALYVLKLFRPKTPVALFSSEQCEDTLFLALSLAKSGNRQSANELLHRLLNEGRFYEGAFRIPFQPSGYMISSLQLNALLLELICDLEYQGPERIGLVKHLFQNRQGDYWSSTKDTAFVAIALSQMPFFTEAMHANVSVFFPDGSTEQHHLDFEAEELFQREWTLSQKDAVQILLEGSEGLLWKWTTQEEHPLDGYEPNIPDVLHREVQRKHTFLAHQGAPSEAVSIERSLFIPIDSSIVPHMLMYHNPQRPGDWPNQEDGIESLISIQSFRIQQTPSGQRILWINGSNTGVPIHDSVQITGMDEHHLILSADPWGINSPHPMKICFTIAEETLHIGDIVRSHITVRIDQPMRYAALEERLPASWVEHDLYQSPSKSRSKFFWDQIYFGHYPDFVDIRYSKNTAFFTQISSGVSEYYNEYKIIAAGSFALPPLHLFEMYEETNAYQSSSLHFVVDP